MDDPVSGPYDLFVNRNMKVSDLREKLGGYPGHLMHVEGSHGLDDDDRTLGKYGVAEGHTVIISEYKIKVDDPDAGVLEVWVTNTTTVKQLRDKIDWADIL